MLIVVVVVVALVAAVTVGAVIMVVGTRQTHHWETQDLEVGRLRLGKMEPTGLSSTCRSATNAASPDHAFPRRSNG